MKTVYHFSIAFFLLLTTVSGLYSDDFEVIKKMPYGPSQEVVAQNSLVCLGTGTVLQICLLFEESLVVQSEIVLSDYINGMAIEGDYLYVANDEKGLLIIDISEFTSPQIIASYETNSSAKSVYIQGDTLYLQAALIEVIDIQNKSNPTFIEHIYIDQLKKFSIYENIIFAGCGNNGLKIFDISELSSPQELAVIDTLGNVNGIFYSDTCVYVVSSQKGLVIIDVNDLSNPQVIESLDTSGFPDDVYVYNNHAYISDFYSVPIIDISNKNDPQEINSLAAYPYSNSVFVESDYLYSTSENEGVRIYDISAPEFAEKVYTHNLPDAVHHIIYNKGTLYRNDSYGDSVTVSKFSFPDTTGVNSTYVNGFYYLIRDSYLFVGDGDLVIYDISDARNPAEISRFNNTSVRYFALQGDTAFCTTGNSNLLILDISNTDSIKEIGSLEVPDYLRNHAIYKSNLYVQNSSNGFIVYDVSDFNNIEEKMRIDLAGVRYIQIKDSLLFVAADWNGLSVYDISDPDTLSLAGQYNGTVISFFIDEHLIYTASRNTGMKALDWSNLEDIQEIAAYDSYGECNDIFVSADTIIVADGENGVLFLKKGIEVGIAEKTVDASPQSFSLHQNWPNPFNPKTMISYNVGSNYSPLHVELAIYNLLGQKVATLVDKKQTAGTYNVQWDASAFASGVYYYRIVNGDYQDAKKMILLK